MIVILLIKMFINAKLAFRSKNLSINFIRENISNLIDHLLYLRMSPSTINYSDGVFLLKLRQPFLSFLMMFHESNAGCEKTNRFSTACWRLKYPILASFTYSFEDLNDVLLLTLVRC
jgi:hypothetical protein